MQEFESYPKLANLLLHAANNWKTDLKWSETLGEINKICKQATELRFANEKLLEQNAEDNSFAGAYMEDQYEKVINNLIVKYERDVQLHTAMGNDMAKPLIIALNGVIGDLKAIEV